MILEINGYEYKDLHVTKFAPEVQILDGEGTGRTKSPGWDMIRDPHGYIINFKVEFFSTRSDNPDFIHFWQTALSLGSSEFVNVRFTGPAATVIEQEMYYTVEPIEFVKSVPGGPVYTGPIKASFIAKKGFT